MTLVTYLRKSFSIREDDSRAPHFSPTLCQYNRLDRLVWEGLGFFFLFFSQFNLELFREDLLYFFKKIKNEKKKKLCDLGEEAFQLFNISPIFSIRDFVPTPF